jgi:hypothetical protein
MTHMCDSVLLLDDDGTVFEIPADDVEIDGDGFWLLATEGEDEECFYEFVDVEIELEDDQA